VTEATWRAPRLWPGEECFILGGGPSLTQADADKLNGRRVVVVNQSYRLAMWADVLFYGDCRWINPNREALLTFGGLKVTTCRRHTQEPGVHVITRKDTGGLSLDPGSIVWNLSSGACAINLAFHFGVKRIVLLGFDMQKVPLAEGETGRTPYNFHADYQVQGEKHNPYPRFLRTFPALARDLAAQNVEVVNATPESALTIWPARSLDEVLSC
jgi:hypothetical protein